MAIPPRDYLRWRDVGFTETEKSVPYLTSEIRIRQSHIDSWRNQPDGVWEILVLKHPKGRVTYSLGAFVPLAAATVRGRDAKDG